MLKMRLQRVGRKHEPIFRLVLTDSKNSTKSGKFKEILGSYDPRKTVDLLKTDRIKHWLDQGIAVTGSVHNLLVNHKVINAKKINVLPKKTYTAPIIEAPKEEAKVVAPTVAVEEKIPEVVVETPAEETPSTEAPAEEVVQ